MPTLQELLANNPEQISQLYGLQAPQQSSVPVQPDPSQDPTEELPKGVPTLDDSAIPNQSDIMAKLAASGQIAPPDNIDDSYKTSPGLDRLVQGDQITAEEANKVQNGKDQDATSTTDLPDDKSLFSRISDQMKNQQDKGNLPVDGSDDSDEDETPTDSRKPASGKDDDSDDDSNEAAPDAKQTAIQSLLSQLKPQGQQPDALQAAISKRNSTINDAEIGKYLNLAASGIGGVRNKGARPTEIHNEMNDDAIKNANTPINDVFMKNQYAEQQIKDDPNSDYSQLMRTTLQKMGVNAPANLTGGSIEKAFPSLSKMYDAQLQTEARKDIAAQNVEARKMQYADLAQRRAETGAYRDQVHKDQLSHQSDQDFEKLAKSVNAGTASSRSQLGRTANQLNNADRVDALIKQTQSQQGGASPQQLYELARAQDALVSGGSGTVSGTAHLMPATAINSFANFQQWLTNSPTGSNPTDFVNRIADTVKRERGVAQQTQAGIVNQIAPGYAHLKNKDPERYNAVVNAALNVPGPSPQGQSGSQQFTSDVTAYAEKHKITPEQALAIKLQRTGGQ